MLVRTLQFRRSTYDVEMCFGSGSPCMTSVVLLRINRPDGEPTGWNTRWYGPGRGGWGRMPTGQ